jgi:hypothetical protein
MTVAETARRDTSRRTGYTRVENIEEGDDRTEVVCDHGFLNGFISGMLDADGTICMKNRPSPNIVVSFYNDSQVLIQRIREIIGEEKTNLYIDARNGKISYNLTVKARYMEEVLSSLRLVMKEDKRLIAIEYIRAKRCGDERRISELVEAWERVNGRELTKFRSIYRQR